MQTSVNCMLHCVKDRLFLCAYWHIKKLRLITMEENRWEPVAKRCHRRETSVKMFQISPDVLALLMYCLCNKLNF